MLTLQFHHHVLQHLSPLVGKETVFLEYGFGRGGSFTLGINIEDVGQLATMLCGEVHRLVLWEKNPDLVTRFQRLSEVQGFSESQILVQCVDLSLPLELEIEVDVIMISRVLHHLSDPVTVLRALAGILKEGVLVVVEMLLNPLNQRYFKNKQCSGVTQHQLMEWIEQAGLTTINSSPFSLNHQLTPSKSITMDFLMISATVNRHVS